MAKIIVKNTEVNVIKVDGEDYICLTDMLRTKISPEFKIYIVKEFQRLKTEGQRLLGWSAKRELSKNNLLFNSLE